MSAGYEKHNIFKGCLIQY